MKPYRVVGGGHQHIAGEVKLVLFLNFSSSPAELTILSPWGVPASVPDG